MLASKLNFELRALAKSFLRTAVAKPRPDVNGRYSTFVPGGIVGTDNVVRSKLPDVPDFKNVTVTEGVRGRFAGNWGKQTAYECAATGLKFTHDEVFRLAASFGAALQQMGLKRGDIVAILLPNCPQYVPIMYGMFMTGIIASPMNPALTPTEIGKMVAQATPKAVVTFPEFLPVIKGLQGTPAGSSIKDIIFVGEGQENCHNFSDMSKADSSSATFLQGSKIDATQEPALVLWSSGTTGPPKGVVLTHYSLNSQLEMIVSEHSTQFTLGEETGLGLIPFFHVMGAVILCSTALQIGAKIVTLPKFDPQLFTKAAKQHKFTVMHVVPPIVGFLAANPALTAQDFDRLHSVISGGAPPQQTFINAFFAKVQKYVFYQEAYGMTEASGASHMLPPATRNTKIGSVGPPTPSTQCKIVDVETGAVLPANQPGEILVKGPQVMQGYLRNDEATKEILGSDGWLHTGDIGYFDEQGFFYVVDRLKELIKVKGLQVSPTELEGYIAKHKKVADVAVIGVPDERSGELPRAYVVRRDPTLTEEELNNFLADVVAEHKQLKGGVEFLDAIPKTPSGKILRKNMLASYHEKVKS